MAEFVANFLPKFISKSVGPLLVLLSVGTFSASAFAAGAEILTCKDASSKVTVTIANSADGDYASTSGFKNGADQSLKGAGITANILIDDRAGTISALAVDKKGNFIQVMASALTALKPTGLSENCAILYPHAMAFSTNDSGRAVLQPNLVCQLEVR